MRLLLINIPFTYIVILLAYIIKRIHERFGILETIHHYIDLFVDLGILAFFDYIAFLGVILLILNMFALFFELVYSMYNTNKEDARYPYLSIILLILEVVSVI